MENSIFEFQPNILFSAQYSLNVVRMVQNEETISTEGWSMCLQIQILF
jgi:hypothetical protein